MKKIYARPTSRVICEEMLLLTANTVQPTNAVDLYREPGYSGDKSIGVSNSDNSGKADAAKDNQMGWEDQYDTFDW